MFKFQEYTKNIENMTSINVEEQTKLMKPLLETQSKLSKVAIDTAKENIVASQSWVNETIAALEGFMKTSVGASGPVAASTEFTKSQVEAAPKHFAVFSDIAKSAQSEAMDILLNASKASFQALNGNNPQEPKAEPKHDQEIRSKVVDVAVAEKETLAAVVVKKPKAKHVNLAAPKVKKIRPLTAPASASLAEIKSDVDAKTKLN